MKTMSFIEYGRLRLIQSSLQRRFKPAVHITSRRSSKHNSTGKVFKTSRVLPQVSLEKVFNHPSWSSWPTKQY